MVLLVFGQTVEHEFIVCDDDPYIYGNPHVIDGFATPGRVGPTILCGGVSRPLTPAIGIR